MSLNNIQLNSFLVIDLYKGFLVEIEENPQSQEGIFNDSSPGSTKVKKKDSLGNGRIDPNSDRDGWNCLGECKKNILLIVQYNTCPYLPDKQLNFLTSVLGACRLSLADVAILNIAKAPSHLYKDIQERFKARVIILFGLTPEEFEMPVNFPEFQVQTFNNCTFLYTPGLEELESDKILKSKLWVCLRKIFDLP